MKPTGNIVVIYSLVGSLEKSFSKKSIIFFCRHLRIPHFLSLLLSATSTLSSRVLSVLPEKYLSCLHKVKNYIIHDGIYRRPEPRGSQTQAPGIQGHLCGKYLSIWPPQPRFVLSATNHLTPKPEDVSSTAARHHPTAPSPARRSVQSTSSTTSTSFSPSPFRNLHHSQNNNKSFYHFYMPTKSHIPFRVLLKSPKLLCISAKQKSFVYIYLPKHLAPTKTEPFTTTDTNSPRQGDKRAGLDSEIEK